MAVSKRVRYEVLRRDNHQCRYCGATAPEAKLTIDHVVPVVLGGADDPSNLVAACAACNAGKTSTTPGAPLVQEVSQTALTWSRAMSQAAQERSEQFAKDKLADRFEEMWEKWYWTDYQRHQHPFPLPSAFDQSVRQFLAAGLTFDDFDELIDVALGGPARRDEKWKYFCGCCWKRVRQAQGRASEILAVDSSAEDAPFRTDFTADEIESQWEGVARDWKERGFHLTQCFCGSLSRFCGDHACKLQVTCMAIGAMHGPDELIRNAFLLYPELGDELAPGVLDGV
jgi:hypothetical protein